MGRHKHEEVEMATLGARWFERHASSEGVEWSELENSGKRKREDEEDQS